MISGRALLLFILVLTELVHVRMCQRHSGDGNTQDNREINPPAAKCLDPSTHKGLECPSIVS